MFMYIYTGNSDAGLIIVDATYRKMHILYKFIAAATAALVLVWLWRILNWIWLKPKKVEKLLREQGFHGKSYRLLLGDAVEMDQMTVEANLKPMEFKHDIVPRVLPFISDIVNSFGKNSFIWLGSTPTLLIMDPERVREVLAKCYVYQKGPSNSLVKLLAQGLVSYDTQKWSKHRRIINPAFHQEKLKLMVPAFESSCSEMLSKWDEIVPFEGSCELDVAPYLQTLTSDAISRTAFGSNYEEGRRIFELQKELAELVIEVSRSIYLSGMMFLPTKRNRTLKGIAKEAQTSILNIINKRAMAIQAGEPSGNDLLGILLESNFKEIQEHGNKKFGMSFDDVVEECKLFYIAGQETSSALLVWTLILLAKHEEWQDLARAEILQIFGNKKPDYEGLSKLRVVSMIFNEVLRLYPPFVLLARVVNEDSKLGELSLPAKTQLLMPTIMLHHDEEIWGSDAKEFNPERFRDGVSKATKGKLVYFPFGSGPRVCIGLNFAMLEAKMALALMLQRFCFQISPSYAHAPYVVITMQPQFGAQLILRRV